MMTFFVTTRWPAHTDQWWECKFVGEGIIDQGGGFRDSLCDMAEELCPPGPDDPMPLPFFIRAPNQVSYIISRQIFKVLFCNSKAA